MKKYLPPVMLLAIFETVAVTLWLTKDNLFYLFNFSYIDLSISLGIFLFIRKPMSYFSLLRVKCNKEKCTSWWRYIMVDFNWIYFNFLSNVILSA